MNDNQFFMSTGKMNYDAFNKRMSLSSFDFNSTVSGMIMLFQEVESHRTTELLPSCCESVKAR